MKKITLALLSLFILPVTALAHTEDQNYGHMMDWGGSSGMYWSGWITMVLFWILLVVAIFALLKWIDNNKK